MAEGKLSALMLKFRVDFSVLWSGILTSLNMIRHIAGCRKHLCELQVLTSCCLILGEVTLRGHITARVMLRDLKPKHASLVKWVSSGLGTALTCLIWGRFQSSHDWKHVCHSRRDYQRRRKGSASSCLLDWENLNLSKSNWFFKCLQVLLQISITLFKALNNLCHQADLH